SGRGTGMFAGDPPGRASRANLACGGSRGEICASLRGLLDVRTKALAGTQFADQAPETAGQRSRPLLRLDKLSRAQGRLKRDIPRPLQEAGALSVFDGICLACFGSFQGVLPLA